MKRMNNPYEKLKENVLFTATKEELTLMLYEGALKFCNQAIIALEAKDIEKTSNLIIRVEDIIVEFQLTLNMDFEVSKYLASMYDYIYRRLIDANISKDIKILEEVRDLLRELRDTWKEAMKIAKQQEKTVIK